MLTSGVVQRIDADVEEDDNEVGASYLNVGLKLVFIYCIRPVKSISVYCSVHLIVILSECG